MSTEYAESQEAILGVLWACFHPTHREEARRIKSLKTERLPAVLDALTVIERQPGLPFNLFGLVARAKMALQGKKVEEYWTAAMRHGGLLNDDETYPPPPDSGWWSHGGDD